MNTQELCDYNDWRVPSIEEIEDLVVIGNRPTIDNLLFPNTVEGAYWSAKPDRNFSDTAKYGACK